jgi:hypothetical protein
VLTGTSLPRGLFLIFSRNALRGTEFAVGSKNVFYSPTLPRALPQAAVTAQHLRKEPARPAELRRPPVSRWSRCQMPASQLVWRQRRGRGRVAPESRSGAKQPEYLCSALGVMRNGGCQNLPKFLEKIPTNARAKIVAALVVGWAGGNAYRAGGW